jgi:hypothetical protein
MTGLTLVGNRIKLHPAEFRPVTAAALSTGVSSAASPATFVGRLTQRYERWLNALSPVARDWLQPTLSASGDTHWQQTNTFTPRLALTFLTQAQVAGKERNTAVPGPAPIPWTQLPLPSLTLVDHLLRQTDSRQTHSLLQSQQWERLEQRFIRLEGHKVLREMVPTETARPGAYPQSGVEAPASVERILRQTAVIQQAQSSAPANQPAGEPPGWGHPFPSTPERPSQNGLTTFSPGEINRLTDHVMTQIDRRLLAHRERTGRV